MDYGERRIGLSVSDPTGTFASPIGFMENRPRETLVSRLHALCKERDVSSIVLGLPLHMSGKDGTHAAMVRQLADELRTATGFTVILQDERLTTVSAEKALLEADLRRDRRRLLRDTVAAQLILQNHLDGLAINQ